MAFLSVLWFSLLVLCFSLLVYGSILGVCRVFLNRYGLHRFVVFVFPRDVSLPVGDDECGEGQGDDESDETEQGSLDGEGE